MKISQTGINVIKAWEGLKDGDPSTVNLDPYLCPAGIWTIGWGHAIVGETGRQLRGPRDRKAAYTIYPNGISLDQAEALLREDVQKFERGVEKLLGDTEYSQDMFDALVSFAFNLGLGNLQKSTLLRLHHQGRLSSPYYDRAGVDAKAHELATPIYNIAYGIEPAVNAPDNFLIWNKSNGVRLQGLVNRRRMERTLYLSQVVRFNDGSHRIVKNLSPTEERRRIDDLNAGRK